MPVSASDPIDKFLLKRMREGHISSTTLVFTFFCDVVTQQNGEIWLGSIIRALSPLGINERLTRTAVFRLVRDGWLESRKQGRRSFYQLSKTGQTRSIGERAQLPEKGRGVGIGRGVLGHRRD